MYIYHPSNRKFKVIKPSHFGENFYTGKDVKVSSINRSFYYLTSNIPEHQLRGCKYLYIVQVDKKHLYNLKKDPDKLRTKFKRTHLLLRYLRKHYLGVMYRPNGYTIVCIFKDMIPINIIQKYRGRKRIRRR